MTVKLKATVRLNFRTIRVFIVSHFRLGAMLLRLLLFEIAFGRIHDLTLEDDDRIIIGLSFNNFQDVTKQLSDILVSVPRRCIVNEIMVQMR